MPSQPLVLAAPALVGAAPTPGQVLARTQWAQAEAREHWLALRNDYYGPHRRHKVAAALAVYEQARAAFAEAARAFWASPEGHTYAAAQQAAGYLSR